MIGGMSVAGGVGAVSVVSGSGNGNGVAIAGAIASSHGDQEDDPDDDGSSGSGSDGDYGDDAGESDSDATGGLSRNAWASIVEMDADRFREFTIQSYYVTKQRWALPFANVHPLPIPDSVDPSSRSAGSSASDSGSAEVCDAGDGGDGGDGAQHCGDSCRRGEVGQVRDSICQDDRHFRRVSPRSLSSDARIVLMTRGSWFWRYVSTSSLSSESSTSFSRGRVFVYYTPAADVENGAVNGGSSPGGGLGYLNWSETGDVSASPVADSRVAVAHITDVFVGCHNGVFPSADRRTSQLGGGTLVACGCAASISGHSSSCDGRCCSLGADTNLPIQTLSFSVLAQHDSVGSRSLSMHLQLCEDQRPPASSLSVAAASPLPSADVDTITGVDAGVASCWLSYTSWLSGLQFLLECGDANVVLSEDADFDADADTDPVSAVGGGSGRDSGLGIRPSDEASLADSAANGRKSHPSTASSALALAAASAAAAAVAAAASDGDSRRSVAGASRGAPAPRSLAPPGAGAEVVTLMRDPRTNAPRLVPGIASISHSPSMSLAGHPDFSVSTSSALSSVSLPALSSSFPSASLSPLIVSSSSSSSFAPSVGAGGRRKGSLRVVLGTSASAGAAQPLASGLAAASLSASSSSSSAPVDSSSSSSSIGFVYSSTGSVGVATPLQPMQGFLHKLGDVIHSWKRRFFKINGSSLEYFSFKEISSSTASASASSAAPAVPSSSSPSSSFTSSGSLSSSTLVNGKLYQFKRCGFIPLPGATLTIIKHHVYGKPHLFGICGHCSTRTYVLQADDDAQRNEWLACLLPYTQSSSALMQPTSAAIVSSSLSSSSSSSSPPSAASASGAASSKPENSAGWPLSSHPMPESPSSTASLSSSSNGFAELEPDVVKCGVLKKQGSHVRNWLVRFFKLRRCGELQYFDLVQHHNAAGAGNAAANGTDDSAVKPGKLLGTIPLIGSKLGVVNDYANKLASLQGNSSTAASGSSASSNSSSSSSAGSSSVASASPRGGFVFAIIPDLGNRTFYLEATSELERKEWLDALIDFTDIENKVDPNSVMEGYLIKLSAGFIATWQQRYFILSVVGDDASGNTYLNSPSSTSDSASNSGGADSTDGDINSNARSAGVVGELRYYKVKGDRRPAGVVPLTVHSTVNVESYLTHRKESVFVVIPSQLVKHARKYVMQAKTERDRIKWINAIADVISNTNAQIHSHSLGGSGSGTHAGAITLSNPPPQPLL